MSINTIKFNNYIDNKIKWMEDRLIQTHQISDKNPNKMIHLQIEKQILTQFKEIKSFANAEFNSTYLSKILFCKDIQKYYDVKTLSSEEECIEIWERFIKLYREKEFISPDSANWENRILGDYRIYKKKEAKKKEKHVYISAKEFRAETDCIFLNLLSSPDIKSKDIEDKWTEIIDSYIENKRITKKAKSWKNPHLKAIKAKERMEEIANQE